MSFARRPIDRLAEAEREHFEAKEAVCALRTLVAERKANGDALALAEYRLAAASKALTRVATSADGAA